MTMAPDFSLHDQDGIVRTLSSYRGSWVVLYFYPKDLTPGCTVEACSFRDNMGRLQKLGVQVLGISADSQSRHATFAKTIAANFPLLSDPDHAVCEAYNVWQEKKFMGRKFFGITRTTLIISPDGEVVKRYDNVKVSGHVDQVMKDLEECIGTK